MLSAAEKSIYRHIYCISKLMPEQFWTFSSVYLAKKSVGSAQSDEVYFSVIQLKGKHCRKPHCRNGVVDTFGPGGFHLVCRSFELESKIT